MYLLYDLLIAKYNFDVTRPCRFESGGLSKSFQDCLIDRLLDDELEDFLPQIDHLFTMSLDFTVNRSVMHRFEK